MRWIQGNHLSHIPTLPQQTQHPRVTFYIRNVLSVSPLKNDKPKQYIYATYIFV